MGGDHTLVDNYNIVLDPKASNFEEGTGRLLLVKWTNRPYVDCTHECEQDLILNNVKYLDQLASFYLRDQSPWQDRNTRLDIFSHGSIRVCNNLADPTRREMYEESLQNQLFKNGQQLNIEQAKGVAWLMYNYVNNVPSLLVDGPGCE